MAVSEVSICNYALRLVGGDRITVLDTTTTNGARCDDLFDYLRDDLLRCHHWNFATRMAQLTVANDTPTFEFDFAYTLPADFLRIISVHDNDAASGNLDYLNMDLGDGTQVLATSADACYIKYIAQITDVTKYPADFVMAFQLALARDLAIVVPNSNTVKDELKDAAKAALFRAKSADALGNPPPRRPAGSWATARQSWPSSRWPR
jgi:hypothetical protein